MTTIRQVKDCVGFDLRVSVNSVSPADRQGLGDIENDIRVFVDDGLKKYELYKHWSGGDLYFCRKFFWVDGDRQLQVRVFNQGREDCAARLVLHIAGGQSNELLREVRELLDKIDLQSTAGKAADETLKVFQKFQASYGGIGVELILHFLQEPEPLRQRKVLRVLAHFRERVILEPLIGFLSTASDRSLLTELVELFSKWQDPEVYRAIDRMYKENPGRSDLRIKALVVLGGLGTPAAKEGLGNAAEFDPDGMVRARAQEILQGMG